MKLDATKINVNGVTYVLEESIKSVKVWSE